MSDLISRSAFIEALNKYVQQVYDCDGIDEGNVVEYQQLHEDKTSYIIQGFCEAFGILQEQPTAYNVDAVVEEVEKLDLDGISMVEDGKYKLIRKKEAISLIQTNGICKGRYKTCAECYKKDCPLSTEKTITDKWSDEVRKGGV